MLYNFFNNIKNQLPSNKYIKDKSINLKKYHLGRFQDKDVYFYPNGHNSNFTYYNHITYDNLSLHLAKQSISNNVPLIFINNHANIDNIEQLITHAKSEGKEKRVFYLNFLDDHHSEFFFNYNFDQFSTHELAELFIKTVNWDNISYHNLPLFQYHFYSTIYCVLELIKLNEGTFTFEFLKSYFTWDKLSSIINNHNLSPISIHSLQYIIDFFMDFEEPSIAFLPYQNVIHELCDLFLKYSFFTSNTYLNWPRISFHSIYNNDSPIFLISLPNIIDKDNLTYNLNYYTVITFIQKLFNKTQHEYNLIDSDFIKIAPLIHIIFHYPDISFFSSILKQSFNYRFFVTIENNNTQSLNYNLDKNILSIF